MAQQTLKSKNVLTKALSSGFIAGVALIITGILFLAFRSELISVMLTIVGVLLIVLGVMEVIRRRYAEGVVEAAVGVIVIACGWTVANVTLFILGVSFIAYAIYLVVCSFSTLKNSDRKQKLITLSTPAVIATFGALLIAARWHTVDAIFIAIGVLLVLSGILSLARELLGK